MERGSAVPAEARTSVTVTGNSPPSLPSVTVTEADYCSAGLGAFVSWTYSDPDGDPQSAYQIQIDDTPSFVSPEVDTGKTLSSITSRFVPPPGALIFNTTYTARVRVWDSTGAVSGWQTTTACIGPGCLPSKQWKTPKHAYPLVSFTWSPLLSPSANQPIQFTDLTTFYDTGGTGPRAWSWLFKAPSPSPSSTVQNPIYTYTANGSYTVKETVTDKDGYTCALAKPINVDRPIPVWKEVSPK